MADKREKPSVDEDREDRLSIPLDPETALAALMETGPHVEPENPRDQSDPINENDAD